MDDTKLLHCLYAAKLQSEQEYKKGSREICSQYNLPLDMVNLVHARKAQNLVSDQDYRKKLHDYTVLPEDLKMQWAKRVHLLQSEVRKDPYHSPSLILKMPQDQIQAGALLCQITIINAGAFKKCLPNFVHTCQSPGTWLLMKHRILLRGQTIGYC